MSTQLEILRTIEEQFGSYLDGVVQQLTLDSSDAIPTEKLHVLRGQAIASKRLLAKLRTTLGYDPQNLG